MAWGTFVDVLQTKAVRGPTADDHLSVFYTPTGYRVLCTSHAQVLDELWVVCGSQRPLILRQRYNGYSLVSVAATSKEETPELFQCRDVKSQIILRALEKVQIAIY